MPAGRVRRHGAAGHRLDPARDHEVVGAAHDALSGEVHGLLRAPALAVDARGRHGLGQAGRHPGVAGDVAPLLADLGHVPADHVVDPLGIDPGARQQALQRVAEEVGRVPAGQRTVSLADGGPDGVDDDGFAQLHAREDT